MNKLWHLNWNRLLKSVIKSEVLLSWTGIPLPQQKLLVSSDGSNASIGSWIKTQFEYVCTELPIHENYHWRVYVNGRYSKDCCPEYLKEENFAQLKSNIDKITISTETITEFLQRNPRNNKISTFVLLDHMDWMAEKPELLTEEWTEILENASHKPKFLWRSASADGQFVLRTKIQHEGKNVQLKDILDVNEDLCARLHPLDRVHTYASLHVATLKGHRE